MTSVIKVKKEEKECNGNAESVKRYKHVYKYITKGKYSKHLPDHKKRTIRRCAANFAVEGGRLFYVGQKKEEKREVVIDAERKRQVFLECHFSDIGHHLGQKKTVHRIQSKYYWLGIVKDVVDWIKVCETCQNAERNKNMSRKVRPIKVEAPWEILGINIFGPFPETKRDNTYVVVITDYLSKWVEAVPIQKKDSLSVARCISSTFYRFGSAKTVFCCQSTEFCEEVTKLLCDKWNIVQKVSPVDQPQLSALYDRSNDMLKEAIRQVVTEKQADWDDYLDPVLFVFRNSINPTTKFTPFYIMFNREANLPNEIEFDPLRDHQGQEGCPIKDESVTSFTAAMQEQQNTVKQLVIANMNAAYKQEKKNAKRRARTMPSITFKVTDPIFGPGDSAQLKKLKESHYLSFPVETVLTADQTGPDGKKRDSEYTPVPHVH